MTKKEKAYKSIKKLVDRFGEHVEEYKRNNYNEHQTRVDFIDPFFKALGWDMDNEQNFAEAYREVIHEDKIKIGSSTRAPDYGFTIYGQRKFFVDAKKPSVQIKDDIHPAYQVRRYGWSAKVPISIVTDFEEFAVYDCTKKPKATDKATVGRIKYITYDQYLNEFDFFWDIFGKENLPRGTFDKYVQSDTKKKGTATVDDEFLKSIEEWRTYLATSIALRNKTLSEDEINYTVQKTIDRIIFLRMCEDRGIEQYGELKKASEKGDIYQNVFKLFRIADDKYNSGLFDFKEDKITKNLMIDNKVIKNIIKELYYPNCEYEFSVLPADILGSVYERFLGKTIRLTKAHHAKIEEKPEVRKAGGVYYTPKYIVDYIVENTVGKIIKGKTPKQVEKITVCDPACGSGSFLIGAYQYLLDYHLKYYKAHPPRIKKDNPLTPDGNLTTGEKKRILLNNIYGVDIDTQAVEVTKLNLLLKALEGETQASINQQMQLFHERVLPNLGNNIKCGNSLIGTDFYDNQLDLFPEQLKKINAFDWEEGFPEIFKKKQQKVTCQFHVVFALKNSRYSHLHIQKAQDPGLIGVDSVELTNKEEAVLIETLCNIAEELEFELSALNVCNDHVHALLSVPAKKLADTMRLWKGKTAYTYNRRVNPSVDHQEPIKTDGTKQTLWAKSYHKTVIKGEAQLQNTVRYIQQNRIKHELPPLPSGKEKLIQQTVKKLTTGKYGGGFDAVIGNPPYVQLFLLDNHIRNYLLQKYKATNDLFSVFIEKCINLSKSNNYLSFIVPSLFIKGLKYKSLRQIININSFHFTIKEYGDGVFSGVKMPTTVFVLQRGIGTKDHFRNKNKSIYEKVKSIELEEIAKIRRGLEIGRDKLREKGKIKCISGSDIAPFLIKSYNFISKNVLKEFHKNIEIFSPYRILVRETGNKFISTLETDGVFTTRSIYNVCIINKEYSAFFILGLLCSSLFTFYFKEFISPSTKTFPKIRITQLRKIPIVVLESENQTEVCSQIVKLVDNLLKLNKQLQSTKLETQREQIQRTITHSEKKIDELVYELYGLNEEEIEIIEKQ